MGGELEGRRGGELEGEERRGRGREGWWKKQFSTPKKYNEPYC